jgi:carbon monoxide dehydrogenase subunit G
MMAIWSRHLRTAWAAAVAAALFVTPAAADTVVPAPVAPAVSVVGQKGGSYRIEGSFRVATPAPLAWEVLTDYQGLPSFISSMRSSTTSKDAAGRLLVTQEAVGRAGPFKRRMHVVLEVTEDAPRRIAFRDVCGESFSSYAGTWVIEHESAGARVTYTLDARPHSSPPLFGQAILASNARGLLDQVRREMLRRARTAH